MRLSYTWEPRDRVLVRYDIFLCVAYKHGPNINALARKQRKWIFSVCARAVVYVYMQQGVRNVRHPSPKCSYIVAGEKFVAKIHSYTKAALVSEC